MEFIEKYSHPKWSVKYRGEADLTTRFGLDDTFRKDKSEKYPDGRLLRIHAATDRGTRCKDGECREIILPFDTDHVSFKPWGGGFGSLLFLNIPEGGFEIRIAHLSQDDLSGETKAAISEGEGLKAGTLIGWAGSKGLSKGAHTHTEIVSTRKRSQELDWLCHYWGKKLDLDAANDMTLRDVLTWAEERQLNQEKCLDLYHQERANRGVLLLNKLRCVRMDYKTGYRDKRTFYNSWILFNGV